MEDLKKSGQRKSEIFHEAFSSVTLFSNRFLYGPLPGPICSLVMYLKNVVAIQTMLFLDAILISKYFLIFQIKNPLGFCDDFWTRFISIWIVIGSHLLQFVGDFFPGNY
jgi:hypothetical protein